MAGFFNDVVFGDNVDFSGGSPVTGQITTDGQLLIGSTASPSIRVSTLSTSRDLLITNGSGTIDLTLDDNTHNTTIHGWDGSIIETAVVSVTSDGATITFSVEQSGGGDLTVVFSDGFEDWDTTPPDTISLTPGTDTVPQLNYVYFLQSTKALTVSTTAFPTTEHAPLATVLCQSAASLQTDGPYKLHAWTDHLNTSTLQGHIGDLNKWIRAQNATWISGVTPTLTITANGGAPDNVIFTSTVGVSQQLHTHTFPAFTGTPDIYVVNDSVTPFDKVTDLNTQLTDSTGASMSGKFFSLVIWGVVSEDTSDCKLMCNLPSGSYNTNATLTADDSKFANFSIPTDFTGTGFLIAQLNLRHQVAASGSWTEIALIDLRGLIPSQGAGSITVTGTEFIDSTFKILDNADNTKELQFQVSAVTTATTRTITMVDADLDLATVSNSFPTDAGTAAPTANVLTIAGGTGVNTSAAATTVTVNIDSPVTVPNGGTALTSATAYAVLCGGTISTSAFQSIASVGTSGQVLTSNGAAALPTFQAAPSGGGWAFVSTSIASASANIDFINLTAATTYKVVLDGIQFANDAVGFYLRVSTNNGSSFAAVDYQYDSRLGGGVTSASEIRLTGTGGASNIGNQAGEFGFCGEVKLFNINVASQPAFCVWQASYMNDIGDIVDSSGSGVSADDADGGSTDEIDAIRFIASAGNIANGKFHLYKLLT